MRERSLSLTRLFYHLRKFTLQFVLFLFTLGEDGTA